MKFTATIPLALVGSAVTFTLFGRNKANLANNAVSTPSFSDDLVGALEPVGLFDPDLVGALEPVGLFDPFGLASKVDENTLKR